ncbi:MAG: LAGLIDADG family homing endonuclease, partial [Methanobacteriota archaeon]
MRIAVVFKDRCQPRRCHLECIAFCPPQRTGTEVIWIDPETTKAAISEETCIACGICLTAGTPVSTERGALPIEDVRIGDRVLTHMGRYRRVGELHRRPYAGPIYRIRVTGQADPLEVTEDHPVLAVIRTRTKGGRRLRKSTGTLKWSYPTELKVGDYLVKPRIRNLESPDSWDVPIPMVVGGGRRPNWTEQLISLPLTPDLGRLVGYFLAEGFADDRRATFSFHEREQNSRNDVRRIVHRIFGYRGYEETNTGRGRSVRFDSAVLARVLGSLGRGCDQKRIPSAFLGAHPAVRAELVRGLWRGDGCRDRKRGYFILSTTSPHLAYATQEILASLGIVAGMTSRSRPGKRRYYHVTVTAEFVQPMARLLGVTHTEARNRTASHFLMDDEYVYEPIRQIEIENVETTLVYNLDVDEDETYVAAGQVVH